jgi:L-iditol 2-dehydrogenase
VKKAIIEGQGKARTVEAADPQARGDWVVVEVRAAPMCTEYKAFVNGSPNDTLGHEAAGIVAAVAQPGRVSEGDRVVVMPQFPCGRCALCVGGDYIHCESTVDVSEATGGSEGRATMAQFLVKPDWLLPVVPDDISLEHASMACCGLGPSFGAFERMALGTFDTVLITGLGPVGLGAVINAVHRGARVFAVDGVDWRREKALELGAEAVFAPDGLDAIRDATEGVGVDAALDCSGAVAAHRLCIDAARRRGRVAFVGECSDETPLRVSPDLIRKGLTLVGSWHYNLREVPKIWQVIRARPEAVDRLISHHLPMSQIQQAFELQATGTCAKVVLDPWN